MDIGTIIVGYDGRESADDAVALAVRLAQHAHARLLLVFVYGSETLAEDSADRVLRRGMRALPYGLPASKRAIRGAPAERLLAELAERERANLIVIGSTDLSPDKRILIGSVGSALLRRASCAVAVAPQDYRHHAASPLA